MIISIYLCSIDCLLVFRNAHTTICYTLDLPVHVVSIMHIHEYIMCFNVHTQGTVGRLLLSTLCMLMIVALTFCLKIYFNQTLL